MNNSHEKGPERIPTKEEVGEMILNFSENAVFVRELADEQGPYLIEYSDTDAQGDKRDFIYQRKGDFGDKNEAAATVISVVLYDGEMPCGGNNLFELDPETGEWKEINKL